MLTVPPKGSELMNRSIEFFFLSVCIVTCCFFADLATAIAADTIVSIAPTAIAKLKKDPFSISDMPEFQTALKKLMGTTKAVYDQDSQTIDAEESGKYFVVRGMVSGLGTSMSSLAVIDAKSGRVWVGTMDSSGLALYGAATKAQLPPPFAQWMESIPDCPKPKFPPPGTKPPKVDLPEWLAMKRKPGINDTTVTGTYAVKGGTLHSGAVLRIHQKGSKLRFQISASSGGNTGEASGNITRQGNNGTYQSPDSKAKLTFRFAAGGLITVTEVPPGSFGGAGVSLSGTYQHMNDAVPKFYED